MKYLFPVICLIALALVAIPPCLHWSGSLTSLDSVKQIMLVGTVLWFIAAPLWMKAPR
jgi:hypothetical protein